ncbi:MAG TPA: hypothetical protein VIL86_03230 [Tepidisphaeraceae bacterium]
MKPYNATIEKATIDPLSRLNPRRRLLAEHLAEFIFFRGGRLHLSSDGYCGLREQWGMDRCAVNQAADDLYALGLAEMRMIGDMPVLAMVEGGWR